MTDDFSKHFYYHITRGKISSKFDIIVHCFGYHAIVPMQLDLKGVTNISGTNKLTILL